MPKVSSEYLAERQEHILQAAIRCFVRSGFHATGMAEIIRESELSAGSVYRYYKSKDELIQAIIDRLITSLQQQMNEEISNSTSLGDVMVRCIGVISRRLTAPEAQMLPQTWTEALRNPTIAALVNKKYQPVINNFEELARQLKERGQVAADLDPVIVARVMLSTMNGFVVQKLLFNQQIDDVAFAQTVAQLFSPKAPTGT